MVIRAYTIAYRLEGHRSIIVEVKLKYWDLKDRIERYINK